MDIGSVMYNMETDVLDLNEIKVLFSLIMLSSVLDDEVIR